MQLQLVSRSEILKMGSAFALRSRESMSILIGFPQSYLRTGGV